MKHIFIGLLLSGSMLLSSCCKEGMDGKATIKANVKHHSMVVYGATVYIKFDAKEAPSSLSQYDASFTAGSTEAVVTINNLKCGDYYFYSTGYDPSIAQNVKGGIPFTIRHADRKKELNIDIPVTE
jgi:hypothetical protein